jgi:predicted ArsR family transcriptional regulator
VQITTDDDATQPSDRRRPSDRYVRAREGVEHLQAAARELIHAARAVLDVAEDVVDDPDAVAAVAGAVGALGDLIRHRAAAWMGAGPTAERDESAPETRAGSANGAETIERITVA